VVGKELSLITIDDMRCEDVAEVLSIERVSFSTPWSEILFMNEIYKAGSFPKVARLHERVVGYLCANQVLDEGHILNVTVHPDYRFQGIASMLVRQVIQVFKARGCKSIYLEVRASNGPARRMYERSGFCAIATRKTYYTCPPEDAIIMARNLVGQD